MGDTRILEILKKALLTSNAFLIARIGYIYVMKTQVLVIHGGDTFSKYEDYISNLKNKEITLDKISRKDWKATLEDRLGIGFEVIVPMMPNKANCKYFEWKIWFEKILPLLNNEIILIGHSMGGIFIAKYLSENRLLKKVLGVFLVAAPYDTKDINEELGDFELFGNLSLIEKQSPKIFIYQSKDDPVVPFVDIEKYGRELPTAILRIYEDKAHFNQSEFPELVEDIVSLI